MEANGSLLIVKQGRCWKTLLRNSGLGTYWRENGLRQKRSGIILMQQCPE